MGKLYFNVFKIIVLNIIFLVVFSLLLFLVQFMSANSKINSLMSAMTQDIATNNCLTENSALMYEGLLNNIVNQFGVADADNSVVSDVVQGWAINYDGDAGNFTTEHDTNGALTDITVGDAGQAGEMKTSLTSGSGVGHGLQQEQVMTNLADAGNYGGVHCVTLGVQYQVLSFGFTGRASTFNDWGKNFGRVNVYYNYAVPCLQYVKVAG